MGILLRYMCLLLVCVLVPTLCINDTVLCEEGEEDDCSKCYELLAWHVTHHDRNLFEIQNVFFPPNTTSPVFVTVTYKYTDDYANQTEIWFWSTSFFYIFQPLHVFQFTSLFFSDTQLLTSSATLTLPLNCSNASEDHMTLLTQRLKLYATRQSIASPIDDEYSPKAVSVATMKEWHSVHMPYSRFTVANFVVFPILSWFFLLLLFGYINHCAPDSRIVKLKAIFRRKNNKTLFSYKLDHQNELILSLAFVVLAVSLSAVALYNANNTVKELNADIGKYFDVKSEVPGFRYMYSLVIVTLIEDVVILLIFLISPAILYFPCLCKKMKCKKMKCKKMCKKGNFFDAAKELVKAAKDLTTASENLTGSIASPHLIVKAKNLVKASEKLDPRKLTPVTTAEKHTLESAKRKLCSVKVNLGSCKEENDNLIRATDDLKKKKNKEFISLIKELCIFTEKAEHTITYLIEDTDAAIKRLDMYILHSTDLKDMTNLHRVVGLLIETSHSLLENVKRLTGEMVSSDNISATKIADLTTDSIGLTTIVTILTATSLPNCSLKIIVEKLASHQEPEVPITDVTNSLNAVRLGLKATEFGLIGVVPTIATEVADLIAPIIKLNLKDLFEYVEKKLTKVREDLESLDSKEKLNEIALNLIAAATQLTTVATHMTTAATNIATTSTSLAANLITVAANLETPILYLIHRVLVIREESKHDHLHCRNRPADREKLILDHSCQLSVIKSDINELLEFEESKGPTGGDRKLSLVASFPASQPKPRARTPSDPLPHGSGFYLSKAVSAATDLSKTLDEKQSVPLQIYLWEFCTYSMLFPLCCLANHLNYITIAFIQDLYRATSVAIVYGIIIIFLGLVLNRLPHVFWKNVKTPSACRLFWILLVKIFAVVVLLGYVAMDILMYFFLPIQDAFEDAANHFISIYSTTVVFFTGLVAFFFVRKSLQSQIQVFTKAVGDLFHKNGKEAILDIKRRDWEQLGTDEKDIEVAKGLLKKII